MVGAAGEPGAAARRSDFTRWPTPPVGGRRSAVLILLGEEPATGPGRAGAAARRDLRNHAGQPAFPGGGADPEDAGRRRPPRCGRRPRRSGWTRRRRPSWRPCPGCGFRSAGTSSRRCWPGGTRRTRCGRSTSARSPRVQRVPVAELVDPANRRRGPAPERLHRARVRRPRHARLGLHRRHPQHPARPRRLDRALGRESGSRVGDLAAHSGCRPVPTGHEIAV